LIRRLILTLLLLGVATGARGQVSHVVAPPVRFVTDGNTAVGAADRCHRIWIAEGPGLAAALVPAGTELDTVTCFLLTSARFEAEFGRSIPDWGIGVALSQHRVIAIDVERLSTVGRGLREVFLHEMVHALLFMSAGETWLPTWFHEGCAMRWSGEWRFTDTVSLALEGRVPDLDRLQGRFPAVATMADRAYRTSLLAVDWLQERHGPHTVVAVVAATRRHGNFGYGFEDATGESLDSFTNAFAARMRLRFGWLVMLTRWPTLFVLLALILMVGAVRKTIIARRRLAAMEDEEARPES